MFQKASLRLNSEHNRETVSKVIDGGDKFGAFSSLKTQFIFLVTLVVVGCAAFAVWINTSAELQKNRSLRIADANTFAHLLARSTSTHLENFTIHDLTNLLRDMSKRPDVGYIALKSTMVENLELVFSSAEQKVEMADLVRRAESVTSKSDILVDDRYQLILPVVVSGEPVGHLFIGWQLESSWQLLPNILKRELFTTLPMFVVAIFMVLFMIRRVVKPLEALRGASERIARGDLDIEIKHSRIGEIASLSHAFSNMTQQLSNSMRRIRTLAYKDSLTNLPNRALFTRYLEAALFKLQDSNEPFAVCFLDIDDFSRVNDTLGHDAGDMLLAEVSTRLETAVFQINGCDAEDVQSIASEFDNDEVVLSRFGGDEFTLLLPNATSRNEVELMIEAILCAMREPIWIYDHSIVANLSIGVAMCPKDCDSLSEVLRSADLAMYYAKREMGISYRFFDSTMDNLAQTRMVLEADLRKALKTNSLSLVFQPKVDLKSRRVMGAEALVRWQHPDRGMVMPSEFIQIAEESRLIVELGLWVLKRSIIAAAQWYNRGYHVPVAVNVSAVQLEHGSFVEEVRAILDETKLPPNMLELEVTESIALSDPDASAAQIAPLQEDGVRFAIDDFGTGYSNLSQLRRASFDVFKIDRSFTSTMCHEQDSKVIVETIIAMAKAMNYSTVAEGVESEEEARTLLEAGCMVGQGYLFAKPMPLARFLNHLKNDATARGSLVSLKEVKSQSSLAHVN